ncbi:hypothetical protein LHK_01317 [Laribacter hongkongensis HLHK9]|uniref:Uncharacterized protein n=1 Tax=Laribacter hongkongensis (strain HLHK9) TaxID=557598 RepID=C1D767_LARHH|nr:hypothetical protein LHK_01317 [Laribacter hongkongensis HLHK9]
MYGQQLRWLWPWAAFACRLPCRELLLSGCGVARFLLAASMFPVCRLAGCLLMTMCQSCMLSCRGWLFQVRRVAARPA